jgi:hypothetical protein
MDGRARAAWGQGARSLTLAEPSSAARLVPFFPTHVIAEPWPAFEAHAGALRDAILARRAADPDETPRWSSGTDLPDWGGEAARALCAHVQARIDAMTVDKAQDGDRRRFRWAATLWADLLTRHGAIDLHAFPGTSWTAICCIDDGYGGDADPMLGGELVFLDPRYPEVRTRTPELRTRRQDGSADQHEVRLRAASGQIVMFPSWLMHGVRPFGGGGSRISIAMTFRADRLR